MVDRTPHANPAQLYANAEHEYRTWHETVINDPDYPVLHLAPPVGRLNDPNGLFYDKGIYHAFYQYAPTHPEHQVFWRHATSTDLLYWQDDKSAIDPVDWYDERGCYSGSAFIAPDGTYEFYYTGNVKDENEVRSSYQCLVTSDDECETFVKQHDVNPLIMSQPEGYTAHFRDPKVWEEDGKYYALLGAQHDDLTGAILKYSSDDRRNWTFDGEITFDKPFEQHMGYMWECPAVARMTDTATGQVRDVLIFSPQGMDAAGNRFANLYQCGYVVGELNGTHFTLDSEFIELDAGFEFYAPQPFYNIEGENGEITIGAWCGLSDQDMHPSWENHWLHCLTLPRIFTLTNGRIVQRPADQINDELTLNATEFIDGEVAAIKDQRVFRVSGTVDVSNGPVSLELHDQAGKTMYVTFAEKSVVMDRSGNRYLAAGKTRTADLSAKAERTFDLIVDSSVVEIFIDGGETTFTARCYFNDDSRTLKFTNEFSQDASSQVSDLKFAALQK